MLLKQGADPLIADKEGVLPVYKACGSSSAVMVLAKIGADFNAVDQRGRTCLHYAAESGDSESFHLNIKCGANIDQEDEDGQTSLLVAYKKGAYCSISSQTQCQSGHF